MNRNRYRKAASINSDDTMRHISSRDLFFILALTTAFLIGRLHYFFLPDYDLLRYSYDARWWWGIQLLLDSPAYDAVSVLFERLQFRFITDIYWQHLIVNASQILSIDLMTLNVIVTSLVYLLAAAALYALGHAILQSGPSAFIFTIIAGLLSEIILGPDDTE